MNLNVFLYLPKRRMPQSENFSTTTTKNEQIQTKVLWNTHHNKQGVPTPAETNCSLYVYLFVDLPEVTHTEGKTKIVCLSITFSSTFGIVTFTYFYLSYLPIHPFPSSINPINYILMFLCIDTFLRFITQRYPMKQVELSLTQSNSMSNMSERVLIVSP